MNLSMISNYVKAKWSKGLNEKKVDVTTKDIRLLSCFGNGDDIPVCPALRPSERKMGKFFCGECGCGDKATTWLNGDESDYTKLDHPFLSCPKKMPGFSDYSSEERKNNRKTTIENILGEEVLSNKDLIKPEKKPESEPEKKKGGCPSCKVKSQVRQEIIEKLKEEGIEPNTKDVTFNSRFRELFYSDERIKKISEEEAKGKKGCSSCERKAKLREEVMEELKDSGLEGQELNTKVTRIVQERIREEQKKNLS